MNEQSFEDLLESVRDFGRHVRGEAVAGVRVVNVPEPDVRAIRRASGLSQSQFAARIGVNLRTLQNWEQRRVRPTGPARALLGIVERHPQVLEDELGR